MKLFILLLMAASLPAQSVSWSKVLTFPNTGTFGTYYNGYHQMRYSSVANATLIHSTDTSDNGNGIYSIRLHWLDSTSANDYTIGDNGQTTAGGCVSSTSTWPFSHHQVEQVAVDDFDSTLWELGGVAGADVAPELWTFPLVASLSKTCPGGDPGTTGCKWAQKNSSHFPMIPVTGTGVTLSGSGIDGSSNPAAITLSNPANFANGDYIQLNSGEIVRVTAGGGQHCAGGGSGTNPLTVSRAQFNTSITAAASGVTAYRENGLGTGGALSWDSTNHVLLFYGANATGKQLWVYCPTTNNPTPGTLTAAQSATGCSINGADDWSDIAPYSNCVGATACLAVESALGSGNGKIPTNYYYPNLEYDPIDAEFISFGGNYGSSCTFPFTAATPAYTSAGSCQNSTWTASWGAGSPIKSLTWTLKNPTCTGADCAAGAGPSSSAPPITATGNEFRALHAIDPATGNYYLHTVNHGVGSQGTTPINVSDWVYKPGPNTWTEIQSVGPTLAPAYADNMTWDAGRGGLLTWSVQTYNPAPSTGDIWFGLPVAAPVGGSSFGGPVSIGGPVSK